MPATRKQKKGPAAKPKAAPKGKPKAAAKGRPVAKPAPARKPGKLIAKAAKPAVKPIPDGYHSLTPHLVIQGAAAAIEWYQKALGAMELFRMPGPQGMVMHAELQFGSSRLMLADEFPQMGSVSPKTVGGTATSMMLYVEDVDEVFERAVAAGAQVVRPLADQFYGDRTGTIEDPFGHRWSIGTHIEDLTPEEIAARMPTC